MPERWRDGKKTKKRTAGNLSRLPAEQIELIRRVLSCTMAADEPPRSDFAQECGYVLNHWTALSRFLDDGRLRLHNTRCERQIRDVALGRKNYLFAGSHEEAERTAVLYSLMRTAALHGVALFPYLSDVLTQLTPGWDPGRLDELLPGCWRPGNAPP